MSLRQRGQGGRALRSARVGGRQVATQADIHALHHSPGWGITAISCGYALTLVVTAFLRLRGRCCVIIAEVADGMRAAAIADFLIARPPVAKPASFLRRRSRAAEGNRNRRGSVGFQQRIGVCRYGAAGVSCMSQISRIGMVKRLGTAIRWHCSLISSWAAFLHRQESAACRDSAAQ